VSIPPLPSHLATGANAVVATSGQRVAQARMKTYSVENILATWPGRRYKKITGLLRTTRDWIVRFDLEPMARFQYCAVRLTVRMLRCLRRVDPEFPPAPFQIFSWDVMGCGRLHAPRPPEYLVDRWRSGLALHLTVLPLHTLAAAATSHLRSRLTSVCTSRSFGRIFLHSTPCIMHAMRRRTPSPFSAALSGSFSSIFMLQALCQTGRHHGGKADP
jgi:hypothetical protein